jgi:hypothetical protein
MIGYIIYIYFAINLFLAGYYLADNYGWAKNNREKVAYILTCITTIFLGVFIVAFYFLQGLFKSINDYFQIRFWFNFYLMGSYGGLKEGVLQSLNRVTKNTRNKNTLRNKIYRKCVELINKRNNYTPTEEDLKF